MEEAEVHRVWVGGLTSPGLVAEKTDCNLVPKLVLRWVERQKNRTSTSLLFISILSWCPLSLFS